MVSKKKKLSGLQSGWLVGAMSDVSRELDE
jgi:hypothetical protein